MSDVEACIRRFNDHAFPSLHRAERDSAIYEMIDRPEFLVLCRELEAGMAKAEREGGGSRGGR